MDATNYNCIIPPASYFSSNFEVMAKLLLLLLAQVSLFQLILSDSLNSRIHIDINPFCFDILDANMRYQINPSCNWTVHNQADVNNMLLQAHNIRRSSANLPPLKWNDNLAKEAKQVGLRWVHDHDSIYITPKCQNFMCGVNIGDLPDKYDPNDGGVEGLLVGMYDYDFVKGNATELGCAQLPAPTFWCDCLAFFITCVYTPR